MKRRIHSNLQKPPDLFYKINLILFYTSKKLTTAMQEQSIMHVINELNYNCQPIFKMIDFTVKVISFRNVSNSFLTLLLFNFCVFISANTFELCVCILMGIAAFSLFFAPWQPHCGPKYIKNKADLMVRVWNSNSQLRQVAIQVCSISRYIRFMLDSG